MELSVGPLGKVGLWSPSLPAPRGVGNKPSLLCPCIILHCRIQEQCSNKEGREVWGLWDCNPTISCDWDIIALVGITHDTQLNASVFLQCNYVKILLTPFPWCCRTVVWKGFSE